MRPFAPRVWHDCCVGVTAKPCRPCNLKSPTRRQLISPAARTDALELQQPPGRPMEAPVGRRGPFTDAVVRRGSCGGGGCGACFGFLAVLSCSGSEQGNHRLHDWRWQTVTGKVDSSTDVRFSALVFDKVESFAAPDLVTATLQLPGTRN